MEKKEKEVKSLRDKFIDLVLIVFVIFLSLSLIRKLGKVKSVNQRIEDERISLEKMEADNKELEKRIEDLQSQDHIEKQLRDKLGLAKEGEIVIVLPDEEFLRSLAPKDEDEIDELPSPNWKKWLELFN